MYSACTVIALLITSTAATAQVPDAAPRVVFADSRYDSQREWVDLAVTDQWLDPWRTRLHDAQRTGTRVVAAPVAPHTPVPDAALDLIVAMTMPTRQGHEDGVTTSPQSVRVDWGSSDLLSVTRIEDRVPADEPDHESPSWSYSVNQITSSLGHHRFHAFVFGVYEYAADGTLRAYYEDERTDTGAASRRLHERLVLPEYGSSGNIVGWRVLRVRQPSASAGDAAVRPTWESFTPAPGQANASP